MKAGQAEFDFDAEPLDEEPEKPPRACTASADVLEKIKSLLRLAKNSAATPAEAELAATRAFALAERHHVDMAALNLDDQGEPLVGEHIAGVPHFNDFVSGLFRIARKFFHVETCWCPPKVLLVGRETDVAIAGYVLTFLRRAGNECLKTYEAHEKRNRRKVTTRKRKSFLAGFIWGAGAKLNTEKETLQLTDQQNALVLAEETARKAKMMELVPNTTTVKPRAFREVRSAAGHGFSAGLHTEIHKPLTGGKSNAPLALKS